MAEKKTEPQPEAQPGVDWSPNDEKVRLQGKTAEEIVAERSEDKSRGDAYTDSFVLQTNKVELDVLKGDESHLRGMAQQVINRALFKGLHAKGEPKLENVEVIHEGLTTQSVRFSWSVPVIPAVIDLDPASTVDKIQNKEEEKHRDPVVSRDVGP